METKEVYAVPRSQQTPNYQKWVKRGFAAGCIIGGALGLHEVLGEYHTNLEALTKINITTGLGGTAGAITGALACKVKNIYDKLF